ncbi:hypothetical protein BQ8794_240255 [Mesorhizobium prunaredense]|uniref:Uncharacterized protein n=1 Tax=Mesorhizobium prunaredense TaxID=1631249 RepID=A0A1R3VCD8_9HYPH|nr:hypothetical protein BQ8794_240255 [Mesorhizobium prunaredense]
MAALNDSAAARSARDHRSKASRARAEDDGEVDHLRTNGERAQALRPLASSSTFTTR